MSSPFLQVPPSEWVASNTLAFALRNRHPLSRGHTLVVPLRPVASWSEATREEQIALLELVDAVKRALEAQHRPDGYTVSFDMGATTGQPVPHLHLHVIPRYSAPRPKPLSTGGEEDPFFLHLEPLFARATEVAVLAAFVQDSGLRVLRAPVEWALARGARVRVLTSDYLAITQASALRRLLDWMEEVAARQEPSPDEEPEEPRPLGTFEARVVETERLKRAFHPKSWRFEGPELATAFVGSSNVSRSALKTGVEWNLRLERESDPGAWRQVVEGFEVWWRRARPLDAEWVEQYAAKATQVARALPPGEDEEEPAAPRREPHVIQREALAALAASRTAGRQRALAVLATGLGKTYLAVLDVEAFERELGRPARVLFLAHRAELLAQAAETFRSRKPELRFGWYVADSSELTGHVVLASVQKLSRPKDLARLREAPPFDYAVVDEAHHSDAPSYRAILARLAPRFLLGLTATPERADEGDVLGLFDDHVAYRADMGEGITRGLLAPFAYHGLKDDVAYENIPWRSRRFDSKLLEEAVQTDSRMQRMWRAWQEHPGTRSLVFCCSISHAEYVRAWLDKHQVRVAVVHSGPGSADRALVLRELAAGTLDAVCVVDLFNEGVDVPAVDRIVMLRPTESQVIFLQQLGRGLRRADGKKWVTIIDFVGNHRIFLDKLRRLFSTGREPLSLQELQDYLETPDMRLELPPGCSVDVELEAKNLLAQLLRPADSKDESEIVRVYKLLRDSWGRRPKALEMYRLGYRPGSLRQQQGGWLQFVQEQGDLTPGEALVLESRATWFERLEAMSMQTSFDLVLLKALLETDALHEGLSLSELATHSLALLKRTPELRKDLESVKELSEGGADSPGRFLEYWVQNPVQYWLQRKSSFRLKGEHFTLRPPVPAEAREAFAELTRELVEYRLAQYCARAKLELPKGAFEVIVNHNASNNPILFPLDRNTHPDMPQEPILARLPDGERWWFNLVKVACNVARPETANSRENHLPKLLRSWFGENAGAKGTKFSVRFTPTEEGWTVAPVGANVIHLPLRRTLPAYPTLRAAAGAPRDVPDTVSDTEQVWLPVKSDGDSLFAVRASGDSMQGGKHPIRDGDWLVMRRIQGEGVQALQGEVALVQMPDPSGTGFQVQVKRIVREGNQWLLRSDNRERPSFPLTQDVVPLARLVEVIAPESLAPATGTLLTDEQAMKAFGLSAPPRTGRHGGHLFLCLKSTDGLAAAKNSDFPHINKLPGETAFVLTRSTLEQPWRYAGVARWIENEERWDFNPPPYRAGHHAQSDS